jgi:hypothetical protein
MDKNLSKPEGLSPAGERAYETIISHLKKQFGDSFDEFSTGGCKAFYSPEEWRERGEMYGKKSELIVVYDGGELRPFFNMDSAYESSLMYADFLNENGLSLPGDYNMWSTCEIMQAALREAGVYAEECTGWYAAIYKI